VNKILLVNEPYNHLVVEQKWQQRWDEASLFATPELSEGDEKAYILNMFPYPSGSGLHVGHLLGYTGTDILARTARMQGKKVLHPMGWDAFGLPAENYAIKTGVHPAISTEKNTKEYKRQFRQVGISYDWSKEINTSSPDFYKWTQWLFEVLYKKDLAYRKDGLVNWCPQDQTVLANEQVVNGCCDRCGTQVIQKNLKQWYFKITDYSERLLEGLDDLDWPEKIKTMQRNWIGRSEGAEVYFTVANSDKKITVFTTRPDTIFGATYLVMAPENSLVASLVTDSQKAEVELYQETTAQKNELERTFLDKKKTGVFTGSYAINPATNEQIPVWVADYVLNSYGTGAVMGVPAHDERDKEFAQTYRLPIVEVIDEVGNLINSGGFSGKKASDSFTEITTSIGGTSKTIYRLRDWLVSRQRFWGAPIPVAYDSNGGEHLIPEESLPVLLPMEVDFKPTGESPLAGLTEWRSYTDPTSGEVWQREADTLDTFVCSSWYYLRYPNPNLTSAAFDPSEMKKWLPVDRYVGGVEHAVLHLLYARFITKVLFDAGCINFEEPFLSLRNQGSILGPDHSKMSKSKGNVVNPDDVIAEFGADTLRVYEMFMAPFELEKPWNTNGMIGVRRFLEKLWRLQEKPRSNEAAKEEQRSIHSLIKKVTNDIADCKFNTAVAAMMETINTFGELSTISSTTFKDLLLVINPFAPHITEELWSLNGFEGFCSVTTWPEFNPELIVVESIEYPVQVNGKVRARVQLSAQLLDKNLIQEEIEKDEKVQGLLAKQTVKKVIVVPGKLISYVI
jgi:leucyl-tRNA synthetase